MSGANIVVATRHNVPTLLMKFRLVYVNDRNPSVLKTSLVKFEMKYNALVLSEIKGT
jgi:hypothetical protein